MRSTRNFDSKSVQTRALRFDFVDSLRQFEVHDETIEKAGLSEQADSDGVKSGCETCVDRKLNYASQVYIDIGEMRGDVRATHTSGHLQWCRERIQSQRLHEGTRKDAMVGAGIHDGIAGKAMLA